MFKTMMRLGLGMALLAIGCGPSFAQSDVDQFVRSIEQGIRTRAGAYTVSPPVLLQATLELTSGSEGKDSDTALFVEVWTQDRRTKLASLRGGESCKDCEYEPGSTNLVPLVVNTSTTKPEAQTVKITMCYEPAGSNDWDVATALLTLRFSDGTTIERRSERLRFTNKLETPLNPQQVSANMCKQF